MIPYKRRKMILDLLKEQEYIYLDDIVERSGVSEPTIRRDLKYLEDAGEIERLHGGAARLVDTRREVPLIQRTMIHAEEKQAIGRKAASLVSDNDRIFIDAGTTTHMMVSYLSSVHNLQVFTNGITQMQELLAHNIPCFFVGGEIKSSTQAAIGPMTIKTIDGFLFDKCFIGANGASHSFGFTNADPDESIVKEHAITHSKLAYVLVDNSKFDAVSFCKFADFNQASVVTDAITDDVYEQFDNIIICN
ncbi:DeoR/GlpR family DNA-binding transcription regulator [Culicoidibacter larvae]|uniref:DeoR/GlpR transcriptional regulator n=1 Tax=Culicoidibacter larvae TaxID=2579976 RepID=A0A5R8QBG0_9FIRM|nr:DeoR/GlpR family DNA-binding transcription regulator [Culicoidibacter larvae]TLG72931.1 DeoR/GlpR transcriptional regulator [Culicoidibacter larvae]